MFGLLVIATWVVGIGWVAYGIKTAKEVDNDMDI